MNPGCPVETSLMVKGFVVCDKEYSHTEYERILLPAR